MLKKKTQNNSVPSSEKNICFIDDLVLSLYI